MKLLVILIIDWWYEALNGNEDQIADHSVATDRMA